MTLIFDIFLLNIFFNNVIYIKKRNVTLINIKFIFKKIISFKFIFKNLIELIK